MRIAVVMPRGSVMDPDKANSMETVARALTELSQFKGSLKIICDAGYEGHASADVLTVPAGLNKRKRADAVEALLRAYDPDHIEYHQQLESASSLARRFPDKTNVLYRHTRIRPPRNAVDRLRYGARLNAFTQLIFVSEAARTEFLGDYPAFAGRASAICNPIDTAAWRASPDARENLILFSGRAMPEKGLAEFCGALADVLDRRPDWRGALMLGDWERHQAWAAPHIEALNRFGDRVEIHKSAALSEVMTATRRAAIAVTPSFVAEALGLTALEAHAAGAALISSGRGGLREASGDHAIYADPPHRETLVDAMSRLIDDPLGRIAMARAGQARVAAVHSPAVRSNQLDMLRESLMTRRKSLRVEPERTFGADWVGVLASAIGQTRLWWAGSPAAGRSRSL